MHSIRTYICIYVCIYVHPVGTDIWIGSQFTDQRGDVILQLVYFIVSCAFVWLPLLRAQTHTLL